MKHILFIIVLVSLGLIACAQQTPYADLPVKSTTAGGDGHTIVSGGEPYKMTTSVLLGDVNDSINWLADSSREHTDAITALEAGSFNYDTTYNDARVTINSTQQRDSVGDFNILSYGATDDGAYGDEVGIQAAIDAAALRPYGGTVDFPDGSYGVETEIVLKSNVHLQMSPNTRFYMRGTLVGGFWTNGGAELINASIDGGTYSGSGTDWNIIDLYAAGGTRIKNCRFNNMTITGGDTAIAVYSSYGGWATGLMFDNMWLDGSQIAIALVEGPESAGTAGHLFSNTTIQDGINMHTGIYMNGNENVFSSLMMWDFGIGDEPPGNIQKSIWIDGDAQRNEITAGMVSFDEANDYDMDLNSRSNSITMSGDVMGLQKKYHTRITFDNEDNDTIIRFNGNYVIDDIKIAISEEFDDSGTDFIDIGYHSSLEFFVADGDLSDASTYIPVSNTPRSQSAPSGIIVIAKYDGENNDATQGAADVYIYMTPLIKAPTGTVSIPEPGPSWPSITTDEVSTLTGEILLDATGQINIDSDNAINFAQTTANRFIVSSELWALADLRFSTATAIKTSALSGNTLSLSAYDVDGTAYLPFITLTAGNTPTMTFPQSGGGTTNFLNADGGWTTPAGGSVWTKSTTNLSPATAGDDILLNSGENIYFLNSNTRMEPQTNYISFYAGGSQAFDITSSEIVPYGDIVPSSNNNTFVGTPSFSAAQMWSYRYGFKEMATPSAPSANQGYMYMDNADEKLYFQNSTDTYELGNKHIVENGQTGTSYTLVLTDDGKRVTCTNASPFTLTVPPNSSVAFPIGTMIVIEQWGAGVVTIAEGAGVTINSFGSALDFTGQYATAVLTKDATDIWILSGNIE